MTENDSATDDTFGDTVYEGGDAVDDSDVLDPTDDLSGQDPDELGAAGFNPPDREPYNLRHVPTGAEELRGESLDDHLAEEEPEIWATGDDDTEADPRAGRLVAPDEGAHSVHDTDLATDVGPDGYQSSAEEAAMYIVDEDRDVN
jgi:hypothetical protein